MDNPLLRLFEVLCIQNDKSYSLGSKRNLDCRCAVDICNFTYLSGIVICVIFISVYKVEKINEPAYESFLLIV